MIIREVTDVKQKLISRNAVRSWSALVRLCGAALIVLFTLTWAVPVLAETPPPDPLCFDGPTDYTYSDDSLWINIQKRFVEKPTITYFVCDVQTTDPAALKTALSGDEPSERFREPVSDIADRHGAKLAVNGDSYNFHRAAIIIRNGELVRAKKTSGHQLLVLDKKGDLSVITDRGKEDGPTVAEELLAGGAVQVWAFGPELVRDGVAASYEGVKLMISLNSGIREPRTAIGQVGPLHYVIVIADGRHKGYSDGMTLPYLQQVFLDAGARTAFNLDGGGSTTLYFCGEVLNKPGGGGQRYVSDILYF